MILLGCEPDGTNVDGQSATGGPTGHLGACLARDGSTGARVEVDLDTAHAGVVVGKRGYGKSYTLGVLAEALADTRGTTPIILDPMGTFESLATELDGVTAISEPKIRASAVPARMWPELLDLSPTGSVGGLVWQAASESQTLAAMVEHVSSADVDPAVRRAARNYLELAADWGVFAPDGLTAADLLTARGTVLDSRRLDVGPMNALAYAVAVGVYERCVRAHVSNLPWLLVDEAHVFFAGIAGDAIETVLTRGRAPGVSLVAATQRPAALPPVAISQSDLVISHRLTAEADLEALARARPSYVTGTLEERLPDRPGEALVVDDATEAVHVVRVRERETTHDGDSVRVRDVVDTRPVTPETTTRRTSRGSKNS